MRKTRTQVINNNTGKPAVATETEVKVERSDGSPSQHDGERQMGGKHQKSGGGSGVGGDTDKV